MRKVYDTECFYNMFLYVDKDWDTGTLSVFEISERKDDSIELKKHIKSLTRMIGFNNLSYDYPLLHYWLHNKFKSVADATLSMKECSDRLINTVQPKFNRVWKPDVEQLDLFSVWHYDNKARTTSLKKLQISMNWWNVEDSSEDFDENVEDYDAVIGYCVNDVESTFEFCKRSIKAIRDRQDIRKNDNIDCLNYSDSKLGEQIMLKEFCETNMTSIEQIKAECKHVDEIKLNDIIFDWIEFESKQFQDILVDLKTKTIRDGQNIGFSFVFDGMVVKVAEGGIHGSKFGVFTQTENRIVKDGDVSSEYPAAIAEYEIAPKHLGKPFTDIVKKHYQSRLVIKEKLKDLSLSVSETEFLEYDSGRKKKSSNSVYGKYGDKYSPLYGNEAVYQVTINCQLLVLKWMEFLAKIPTVEFIQVNTDGVTIAFDKQYEAFYYAQCKKFTELTRFILEWVDYKRMCVRDVNNYCCVSTAGKVKSKGEFVYKVGDDYHKRLNFAVVREAAVNHLLYDKPIEKHIQDEKDVFKFIGSIRFKKKRKTKSNFDDEDDDFTTEKRAKLEGSKGVLYDGQGKHKELPPNVRFVFSKHGGVIRKLYDDGRKQILFDNKQVLNANKIVPGTENELLVKVDYQHYIFLARKLVESIEVGKKAKVKKTGKWKQQLTLGI